MKTFPIIADLYGVFYYLTSYMHRFYNFYRNMTIPCLSLVQLLLSNLDSWKCNWLTDKHNQKLADKILKKLSNKKRKCPLWIFLIWSIGTVQQSIHSGYICCNNKNVTEVTFKDTVRTAGKLADELISLKIRDAEPDVKEIDIVEEFIGDELEEFYKECPVYRKWSGKPRFRKPSLIFYSKLEKEILKILKMKLFRIK